MAGRIPPGRQARPHDVTDAALRSPRRRPVPRDDDSVRARLPLQLRVLRHHRRLRSQAARFTTIFIGIESPRKASLQETKKTQNMRGDLVENVRKIQSYGIQVQAGMIVGFDNDDESIFEEQLRFIQDARIPVSMTGML